MNNFIKIKQNGNPNDKYLMVTMHQLLVEIGADICPDCGSKSTDVFDNILGSYRRCNECFCLWEIDMAAIKEEANARMHAAIAAGDHPCTVKN